MTAERREYIGGAVVTTLGSGITNSSGTFQIAATTGWPTGAVGPFTVVIDPGTSSEEKIKCSGRSGTTVTVASSGRGVDGTAAAAHNTNAVVKHVLGAYDIALVNQHAADTTQDDHTQYTHNTVARTITADHGFSGNPTFSGTPVFSGNPSFTGNPTFTGNPVFSNMGTLTQIKTVGPNATASAGTSPLPMRSDAQLPFDNLGVYRLCNPAGIIQWSSCTPDAATYPNEWVYCDGRALARASYPVLFSRVGTYYGAGDGLTTFNIPNIVGRVIVGANSTDHVQGATGGSFTQTLASGNLPPHTHTATDSGHTHSITDQQHTHGVDGGDTGFRIGVSHTSSYGFSTASIGQAMTLTNLNSAFTGITGTNSAAANISVSSTGSSTAFSVEQPWIGLLPYIKAH